MNSIWNGERIGERGRWQGRELTIHSTWIKSLIVLNVYNSVNTSCSVCGKSQHLPETSNQSNHTSFKKLFHSPKYLLCLGWVSGAPERSSDMWGSPQSLEPGSGSLWE
jgi:hypothetical protein